MHGPALSGWLLTVMCGGTGAYCLLRTRSGTREERVTARGEAVMAFGMAAMAVPAALFTLPGWSWVVYAALFGGAALSALRSVRQGGDHLHHVIGSLAMVYMALVMAPGIGQSAHAGHGAGASAGGIPVLTGLLLAYYAFYVLRSAGRLVPVAAAPASVPGATGAAVAAGWDAGPELVRACRLTMGVAMLTMLLTL